MADRKAELERKKAKLQAMRDEKKKKEEERRKKEDTISISSQGSESDLRAQTEQMLKELGIAEASEHATGLMASPRHQRSAADDSGDISGPPITMTIGTHRKAAQLSMSKVTSTMIPPREQVSYSKETQTPFELLEKEDDDNDSMEVGATSDTPPIGGHPRIRMPHVGMVKPAGEFDSAKPVAVAAEEKPPQIIELSEDEKKKIMGTEDFQRFMDKTTRVIERAIYEDIDILIDYTGEDKDGREGGSSEGEKLKVNRVFYDERWTKHRTVTSLDWSTQHPELLVASYNNNEESPHEPEGVACIWNIKYKKPTPEYIFQCQSAVTSVCFAKFHPNLVVGGTYSGQIVLWDNRSNKRTPVQRTPMSTIAHTHPVYCVSVVGSQNAHNLISVSTDGKMCSWSLDMLSQPQDSLELQHKQTKSVAAICMSFLSADVNNYVLGSEEGAVYLACRHGSKAGISDMFEGHQGPVTGIDCHGVPGSVDFSQYFLTSSFDWTVKLWSIKESRPIYSFEDNSDYVYDVKWSPIHPALFASVDGMGRLDLWNLNNDAEVPIVSTLVEGGVALNKCLWHSSGHQIAVGDNLGKVHIYDVAEPLAQPRNDDWSRFVHTLQEVKNNQLDQEETQSLSSTTSASSITTASPLR